MLTNMYTRREGDLLRPDASKANSFFNDIFYF